MKDGALDASWQAWRQASAALEAARSAQDSLQRERERLDEGARDERLSGTEADLDKTRAARKRDGDVQRALAAQLQSRFTHHDVRVHEPALQTGVQHTRARA